MIDQASRRASRKKYRDKNPDKVKAQIANWHAEHPEKRPEYSRKTRRTPAGWSSKAYSMMGHRCENHPSYVRKGIKRVISKAAFKRWVESRWSLIMAHFGVYDQTGEYRHLPSINRIDGNNDYTLDNIEIISQGKNSSRVNNALATYETKKNARETKLTKWFAEKGDKPRSGKGHRGKKGRK